MSKLKRIIYQLSDAEYQDLYHSLVDSEAFKSADLLKYLREEELSDDVIKTKLKVANNAYYTLRSRLNERIESFFLEQLEGSKTGLYRQVAHINELILSKSRAISIATLKKLEKELTNYDLFNELTLVYKALKKLHINTPEFFQYSQLYNKHTALLMSTDKAESLTSDYFKAYNLRLLNFGSSENQELKLLREEIENINNRYKSHRIFMFKSLAELFHLVINEEDGDIRFDELINEVESILSTYKNEVVYNHLKWVASYLKLLKYYKQGNNAAVSGLLKDLDVVSDRLITNYNLFSCTALYLIIKLDNAKVENTLSSLEKHNLQIFRYFEPDTAYQFSHVVYSYYRSLSCFYANDLDHAILWIEDLFNQINMKDFQKSMIDLKLLLGAYYIFKHDYEEANNLINYVQRIIRINDKKNFEHSYVFMKILKSCLSDIEFQKKERKLSAYKKTFQEMDKPFCSPLRMFNIDRILTSEELGDKRSFSAKI